MAARIPKNSSRDEEGFLRSTKRSFVLKDGDRGFIRQKRVLTAAREAMAGFFFFLHSLPFLFFASFSRSRSFCVREFPVLRVGEVGVRESCDSFNRGVVLNYSASENG